MPFPHHQTGCIFSEENECLSLGEGCALQVIQSGEPALRRQKTQLVMRLAFAHSTRREASWHPLSVTVCCRSQQAVVHLAKPAHPFHFLSNPQIKLVSTFQIVQKKCFLEE